MLDVAKDGYYNTEMCLRDFQIVSSLRWLRDIYNKHFVQAVRMVEVAFGGKYKPIFMIDNSPIHRLIIFHVYLKKKQKKIENMQMCVCM